MPTGEALVWKVRGLILGRAARQAWQRWWRSGVVGMGASLGGFGLLGVVSLWQTYRMAAPPLDLALVAGLGAVWWLSAWLTRRPALGVDGTDETLLRTPLSPWAVLGWPLLRTLGVPLGVGLGLGVLVLAWFPAWWPLAVALPLLAAGRPLVQTLAHDTRLGGTRRMQGWTLGLSFLPLLGMLHPVALPLACVVALGGLLTIWRPLWRRNVPPALLLAARREGVRQGARRLGLPVPDLGPDEVPAPRRQGWPLPGRGPVAASVWRGGLHLLRTPWRLVAAPLVGFSLAAGVPVVPALLLAPLLAVLAPPAPAGLPLATRTARWVRTMPGGAVLGGLVALGAGLAAGLGLTSPLSVLVGLLLPWAALGCLAWLGTAAPGGPVTQDQLRFAAGLAPLMGAFVVSTLGEAWAAPLAVLLIGSAAVLVP